MFKKVSLSTIFQIGILVVIGIMFCMTGNILGGVSGDSSTLEYDHNMDTENYHVEVTLGEDNSYLVSETIQVDMLRERHGIYRYIPMKGTIQNVQGEKIPYFADIELEDCNTNVEESTDEGFYVLKLGDADHTVYGLQTYYMEYSVTPLVQEKAYTDVYYNLFPLSWQNVIPAGSSFIVSFPKNFDHEKLELYYGSYGSTADGKELMDLVWDGNTLEGTLTQDMEFGSGITMYAQMGDDYFTGSNLIPPVNTILVAASVVILMLVLFMFRCFGRDEEIITSVQFQPPVDLDSAAVGYIIDGSVEDKDVLSLILYWADRGHLQIKDTGKKKDLTLIKTALPLPVDAPKYERTLFDELFKKGDSVRISSLKYKCAGTIDTVKSQVKDYVKAKGGLYTTSSTVARVFAALISFVPMCIFLVMMLVLNKFWILQQLFSVLSLILMVIGMVLLCSAVDKWHGRRGAGRVGGGFIGICFYLCGIALVTGIYLSGLRQQNVFDFTRGLAVAAVASFICLFFTAFMKKRTEKCVDWMGRLLGLREFIKTAELDRLKAMAEDNPEWFYSVLPYTYVFGLSDVFAKRLETLAIPAPEWYVSSSPDYLTWNYYMFSRQMSKSMQHVTSTLTKVDPGSSSGGGSSGGSSFGSSGGFSGGGFGGGGGGSW